MTSDALIERLLKVGSDEDTDHLPVYVLDLIEEAAAALKAAEENRWPDAKVFALWDERDQLRIDLTAARAALKAAEAEAQGYAENADILKCDLKRALSQRDD